jgi:hypothetical protein
MKPIFLFLLLLASCVAFADGGARDELSRLDAELNNVRQEQQSVFQNYQMTKELRLKEVQDGKVPASQYPYGTSLYTPPPNYDDVVREQMKREQRIEQFTSDLQQLSVRYLMLEDRRKALLDQIRELKQQPRE